MPNRDLLVLVKDEEALDNDAIKNELEQLNSLLLTLETMDNYCRVHEVFDMNRYRIIENGKALQKIFSQKELKSFVFISNKN